MHFQFIPMTTTLTSQRSRSKLKPTIILNVLKEITVNRSHQLKNKCKDNVIIITVQVETFDN